MTQLQRNDKIQLKADLSIPESSEVLKAGTKGEILHVDEQGYTVVFEGQVTPIAHLSDEHSELNVEPG